MKIVLILAALAALFALSVFCIFKIKTKKQFLILNIGFLVFGFVLLLLAQFSTIPTIVYLVVFAWGMLGIIGWYGASLLSKWIDIIGSKLLHIPYTPQTKEDDMEDDASETSIKFKYYVIAAVLYVLYLMAALPEIQV